MRDIDFTLLEIHYTIFAAHEHARPGSDFFNELIMDYPYVSLPIIMTKLPHTIPIQH